MGCAASKDNVRQSSTLAGLPSPAHSQISTEEESASYVDDGVQRMEQDLLLYLNEGAGEPLRLSCWDYGGQDRFYGLHHLYIGRKSVFFLMFNMEWFLKDSNPVERRQHIAYINVWFDSIATHAEDPADGSIAPILLVGTHKDVVVSPEQHENISTMLYHTFSRKPAWSSVQRFDKATLPSGRGKLWFFPVDNTIGNTDPVLLEIKTTVQEVVKVEKYVNAKVPFVWLKVLERLQEEGRASSITLHEVVLLGQECGMPCKPEVSVEDEVLSMLELFNDLGQVMHHPEPSLRDLVILDAAKYMVAPASRIICEHSMHEDEFIKEARTSKRQLFNKMREGVLDPDLLQILWKDRLREVEVLQEMLVKYGFFVPIVNQLHATPTVKDSRHYLVPALLPITVQRVFEPKLVCYLFLAHKSTISEIRQNGYILLDQVKNDGFFPLGLFPAVIGQIVSECQILHDMTINDMHLSIAEIVTAFGRHRFLLRINVDLQILELQIMVDSSSLIVERVLALVGKAVAQMVPTLDFALAVDQDGGLCVNGLVPKPKGPLVIISGNGGLQDKLAEGKEEISVAPGKRWSAVAVQKHFAAWLPPKGLRSDGYDIFISYRCTTQTSGGMDTELVDGIFEKFCHALIGTQSPRQTHTFLDRHRLEAGRVFAVDFSIALVKSTVAVPIVSLAALQRMLTLTADSDIDNLLLEWVLICELLEIGALEYCVPIMIGDVNQGMQQDGQFITNLFAAGVIAQLPQVVCQKVASFAQKLLEDAGKVPSTLLHARTVRGTVEAILKGLGVPLWDISSSHGGGGDGSRSSAHHLKIVLKKKLFTEVVKQAMKCVEKAEADGKSKVTPSNDTQGAKAEEASAVSSVSSQPGRSSIDEPGRSSIDDWLKSMSLEAYALKIKEYGVDSMRAFDDASEQDVKDMVEDDAIAMKKPHRVVIMKGWKGRGVKEGDGVSAVKTTEQTSVQVRAEVSEDTRHAHLHTSHDTRHPQALLSSSLELHSREKPRTKVHAEPAPTRGLQLETMPESMSVEEDTEAGTQAAAACHSWERIGAERCAQLLEAASRRGEKALNSSRINFVGEGRAGKTALVRGLSNQSFQATHR